jgi:hypothetical protein
VEENALKNTDTSIADTSIKATDTSIASGADIASIEVTSIASDADIVSIKATSISISTANALDPQLESDRLDVR